MYRAFDTDEALEVAWNKLHVERLSKHDLEKVSNEVDLLKRVKHKNIIRFYHTWTNPTGNGAQTIDFITEQMTSGTLKDYLKKAKAIKLKVIRRWCSNILEAVAYLHTQTPPIMHRDLKCANIFINGHVGEVKIGDLGLSGVKVRNKADSVIGTPEFMAPELYEEGYTEKVDIYAFGMCLLEMVVMEYPYSECSNLHQIFKKVCNNEKPDAFYRIMDGDVKNVIAACLRREDSRPSAAELLEHPLFRDWQKDDGKATNLSLLTKAGDGYKGRTDVTRSNGNAGSSANVIDWSDQLDRTVLVSMPDGETGQQTPQGAAVSVVASQANDNGGFGVVLEIPFGDKIKRVKFIFDPFRDSSKHIAQEMVNEFNLGSTQIPIIEAEIERQVVTAREQRKAASRNATPQAAPRPDGSVATDTEGVAHGVQPSAPQPIDGLRDPEHSETFHVVSSEPKTPTAQPPAMSVSTLDRAIVTETYQPSGATQQVQPQAIQPQPVQTSVPPAQTVGDIGNAPTENVVHVYHQEVQAPQATTTYTQPGQAPAHQEPVPGSVMQSHGPSESGYQAVSSVGVEQGSQFQVVGNGVPNATGNQMQTEVIGAISTQHEVSGVPNEAPMVPNGTHMPPPVSAPVPEPMTYSQVAALPHAAPNPGVGHNVGLENGTAPGVSGQYAPVSTTPMRSAPAHEVPEAIPQNGEQLNRLSPGQPLTFADPVTQGTSHAEMSSQPVQNDSLSRSSGSGQFNMLPASTQIPAVPVEHEPSVPPGIPQSTSEQQIRPADDVGNANSPNRAISAPVTKIAIDDSSEFAGHAHGVSPMPNDLLHGASPMPSDMVPVLIPSIQTIGPSGGKTQVASLSEQAAIASKKGTSSLPNSRPPSIVVVGGERRNSARAPKQLSTPGLSAKSLPEHFARPEGSKVPRSSSLAANVGEPTAYYPSHDADSTGLPMPGSNAHSSLVAGSRAALGIRSNSHRSSQSDASGSDRIRGSTSDSLLGTSFDQKELAACLELMEHCSKGRYASVLQKLDQGTPAQFADYDKRTPLHIASARGHLNVCILLLERGGTVGARDRWGRTPYSDAKSNRHEAVIDLLKQHGATEDMDMSTDVVSLQMLQYAAKGDLAAVRNCLVAGARATYADYDQRTPLHLACTEGHANIAELLLVNNADPAARDSLGRTAVDDAITNGHRAILRVLRQYGADIPRHLMGAHSDSQHQLGLDLVENAAKGRINAVTKCLHNGANPNFQDYDNRSALHLAAVQGHIDVVEILLQAGADAQVRDRWGATPRDEALKQDQTAVVDELDNWERKLAERNASSRNDRSLANGGRKTQSPPRNAASASMTSFHPDMFLEKYHAPSSASAVDSQSVSARNSSPESANSQVAVPRPPVQAAANFETEREGAEAGMDEEERILQAEYNEKLRRLRESRSGAVTAPRRPEGVVEDGSGAGVQERAVAGGAAAAAVAVVPTAASAVADPVEEPAVAAPAQESGVVDEVVTKETDEVVEKETDEVELAVVVAQVDLSEPEPAVAEVQVVAEIDENAQELASEIVDNIIDVVVQQDSSESEGALL